MYTYAAFKLEWYMWEHEKVIVRSILDGAERERETEREKGME